MNVVSEAAEEGAIALFRNGKPELGDQKGLCRGKSSFQDLEIRPVSEGLVDGIGAVGFPSESHDCKTHRILSQRP